MASRPRQIGVGLIGLGTVGTAVARALIESRDRFARAIGAPCNLVAIAVSGSKPNEDRPSFAQPLLTTDVRGLIANRAIDVLIELTGKDPIIAEYLMEALRAGKHVVTANKALLASHGNRLFAEAARSNTQLRFEASVAGAIPIIRVLREALTSDDVHTVHGIVNGTCNYILTKMEDGRDYAEALREAQELGYADKPADSDVEGYDAQYKTVILASLLSGALVSEGSVFREGISKITQEDLAFLHRHQYRIRLISTVKKDDNAIQARVHPLLLPLNHPLANVRGPFNAIYVSGTLSGSTMYFGAGAGGDATASAVLADLVDIGRDMQSGATNRLKSPWTQSASVNVDGIDKAQFGYYLRLKIPNPDKRNSVAVAYGILNNFGFAPEILEKSVKRGICYGAILTGDKPPC